jgi:ParB-like chromosome segregation protein Spo0J
MNWRNRIVGEAVVPSAELLANPNNWRVHPKQQKEALKGVLAEIGWVQRIIVNQRTGHVVDGHARAELAISNGEQDVPVLYVDLSEDEERLVLATLDPIGAMAATDQQKLDELIAEVNTGEEALQEMLSDMHKGINDAVEELDKQMAYFVRVEADGAEHQEQIISWLTEKGYKCKAC